MEKIEQVLNAAKVLGSFKQVLRQGWVKKNIKASESDADHSFGVALLVLLYCPSHLDLLKCLKLAIIHDICEVYSKDWTPIDISRGLITPEKKLELELEAIKRLSVELNFDDLIDLFEEYHENETIEAQFVASLDKLETVLQAKYYVDSGQAPSSVFEEFLGNALNNPKIKDEMVKGFLRGLK